MTAELVGLRLALVAIVCGVLAVAVFAGVVSNDTTSSPERDRGETLAGTLSRSAGEGLPGIHGKAPLPRRGRGGTKPEGLGG
jgi:hypothetical protein